MTSIIGASRRALSLGLATIGLWRANRLHPVPQEQTVSERLEDFPVENLPLAGSVVTYWNEHQVPYIIAEHDEDVPFVLGLVHAHLRLGQICTARMIATGRISEMIGPLAVDIDHALRILAPARSATTITDIMSGQTRQWVQRFADGLNHYQSNLAEMPNDCRVLGIPREHWSIEDIIAIGRLAGFDVNWMIWARLLPIHGKAGWKDTWQRLMSRRQVTFPGLDGSELADFLIQWLAGSSRSGSNSLAVSGARAGGNGALMANDPHLGIMIPSTWLIAGVKSPSFHAVGLMGPGLPIFAIGRNPRIAWGGTNMRAASSDLVRLPDMPEPEFKTRHERIRVRWGRTRKRVVRESRWGPVISDSILLKSLRLPRLAVKWAGHEESDEIGAMLGVAQAGNFDAFHKALDKFAVPAQNMLYADINGNIGKVMAAWLPRRQDLPNDLICHHADIDANWDDIQTAGILHHQYNPERGYITSANNRPDAGDIPMGFFFSPEDRAMRMASIISASEPCDMDTLMELQRDVYCHSSIVLRDMFLTAMSRLGVDSSADHGGDEVISRLRGWDGNYSPESVAAATFEQFRAGFIGTLYRELYGRKAAGLYANLHDGTSQLFHDIATADERILGDALNSALGVAIDGLERIADWQDMHRLRLMHPLGRLPLSGRHYRFADLGVGGSSETVMKTAHATTARRHAVAYGSNARHVSDLSDPDANHFVLFGGQDGIFGSSSLVDQCDMWSEGMYIRMPLNVDEVRKTFPHKLVLGNARVNPDR